MSIDMTRFDILEYSYNRYIDNSADKNGGSKCM